MWYLLFLVSLMVSGGIGLAVRQGRERLQGWQEAVASCGLQKVETSGFSRLTGQAGPFGVQVEAGGDPQRAQITVTMQGPQDFYHVSNRPTPFPKLGREMEVGDPSFDSKFFMEGPVPLMLALLDAPTRRLMLRMSPESRLEILHGRLQAETLHESISKILPLLLDLGQRFTQPLDIPLCLAGNAHLDPEAGVRLRNLLVLLRERPEDPATLEALRKARSDASPEIRLRVAKELGAEGRDVLLGLAEGVEDDTVSAEAMSMLGDLPFEHTKAILDHALSRRCTRTARVCLEALGHSGSAAAVDALTRVIERSKGELAAVAAQALGEIGDPAAEPSLILALQGERADLRVAAAHALGRVGSVGAVLPLKETAEHSWLDLELRRAAHQAIAEIQSRLQGASPGQLSLAATEAGQLSLAEAEAGQLSLATDTGGQLSFPSGEPGELSIDDEKKLKPAGSAGILPAE